MSSSRHPVGPAVGVTRRGWRVGTAVGAVLLVGALAGGCDTAPAPAGGAGGADPLSGIEETLDAVERDLDTAGDTAGDTGTDRG